MRREKKIKKIEDNTAADVEILIHFFQEFLQIKQLMPLCFHGL
jgi:hypothetical protein